MSAALPLYREARPPSAELGLPNGWFAVATSRDLARGGTLTRRFMSEDLVLYRTESGEARAVGPYCPHLGAHLGYQGEVVGDTIRCTFHGLCFDGEGTCVKTAYGKRPPPAARVSVRHVREQHGLVLVWHDANGEPPSWHLPELDDAGWTPFVFRTISLRGHPQETSENSLDLGHLSVVHGYRDVALIDEPRSDGAVLRARYAMKRPAWPLGGLGVALDVAFDVSVHGLGYSLVQPHIRTLDVHARLLVCSTPTDAGRIDLRLGTSLRAPSRLGAAGRAAARAATEILSVMFRHDVMQDYGIWQHKRYVPRPALAQGDGPIGLYRRWAAQFYPA